MDRRITYSQISALRACPRKHQLAYEMGIRLRSQSDALNWGSAWHLGLDLMAKKEENIAQRVAEEYMRYTPRPNDAPKGLAVGALLQAYEWYWSNSNLTYEESEVSFEVPIINPRTNHPLRNVVYAGKRDKVVVLPDGRRALMEHKTTTRDITAGSDYWAQLRINSQIRFYALSLKDRKSEIEVILYDVAKRPTTRPKLLTIADTVQCINDQAYLSQPMAFALSKEGGVSVNGVPAYTQMHAKGPRIKETPEMYAQRCYFDATSRGEEHFQRRLIPVDESIEDARWDLFEDAKRILYHVGRGYSPRNDTACLHHLYGKCPFTSLCWNGWKEGDPLPVEYVKVDDVHQELGEAE